MFGFSGKVQGVMEWEANGITVLGGRYFYLSLAKFGTTTTNTLPQFTGRTSYPVSIHSNYDVNEDGAPPNNSGYDNYPVTRLGSFDNNSTGIDNENSFFIFSPLLFGDQITSWFDSTNVLTPPTRTQRHFISSPELIQVAGVNIIINNSGRNQFSNNGVGSLDVNWRQFSNLEVLSIVENYFSGVTKPLPETLKSIYLRECSQLTEFPSFPSQVEYITLSSIPSGNFLNNINEKMSGCTNLKELIFCAPAPYPITFAERTSSLTGTLDLSNKPNLEKLIIHINNGLSNILLSPLLTGMTVFHIYQTGINGNSSLFNDVISNNPNLISFFIGFDNLSWSKNFTDFDIKSTMVYFVIENSGISGDITVTSLKPNLKIFNSNRNTHNVVNISGLTNANEIRLFSNGITNLELPTGNTSITYLDISNNELDHITNSNLISQITSMINLQTLRISTPSGTLDNAFGQNSVNGLGNNLDFSNLINLDEFYIADCGITGSLTLPTGSTLTAFDPSRNTGLTTIINLSTQSSTLQEIYFSNLNSWTKTTIESDDFPNFRVILLKNLNNITLIDLSDRTNTNFIIALIVDDCDNLQNLILPSSSTTNFYNVNGYSVENNVSLTAITNLETTRYRLPSGNFNNTFNVINNSILDIEFPIGINDFIPRRINLNNNNLSQTNIDNTINSIYSNRTKWSVYTSDPSLNISNNNGSPSGIYQAPSGFVLGSNDGTPISALEEVYVLVNNYSWTITY